MQATISLKIPSDLLLRVKKDSIIRGVSLSHLIREKLEEIYLGQTSKQEIRKQRLLGYFGKFTEDEGTREFAETLAESKKQFSTKQIKF